MRTRKSKLHQETYQLDVVYSKRFFELTFNAFFKYNIMIATYIVLANASHDDTQKCLTMNLENHVNYNYPKVYHYN